MVKKQNPARQAYLKKWRRDHPEAISRYNRQYWERRLKREQMQKEMNENDGDSKAVSDN